jgi:hypothetical protein
MLVLLFFDVINKRFVYIDESYFTELKDGARELQRPFFSSVNFLEKSVMVHHPSVLENSSKQRKIQIMNTRYIIMVFENKNNT